MGNRQATDSRKSTASAPVDDVTAEDGDRKQSRPEAEAGKKRRRGRGRKVTDVAAALPTPREPRDGPSHPELITTTTLDAGEEAEGATGTGNGNRRLLELTIYRSYSPAATIGSAVSHGLYLCLSDMELGHIF